MDFNEFCEKCCQYLDEINSDVKVSVINVTKNNGCVLTGLQFVREGNCLAPTIYLEGYYKQHEQGINFYKICDEIETAFEAAEKESAPDIDFLKDYEIARDKLFCKVINSKRNAKLLKSVPYVECMDLAIVFFIAINIGEQPGTILLRNNYIEGWDVELGTIYKDALANTINRKKSIVFSMEDVLADMLKEKGDMDSSCLADILKDISEHDGRSAMFVLTNSEKWFGAACILDEETLRAFSDRIESDYYILPSSVHELILIPFNENISVNALKEMVNEVNVTQVSDEDYLSDTVYKFSRSLGKVVVA